MKSIREKLKSDEKIIFEAKPPYRSFIIPVILLVVIICIPLFTSLSEFLKYEYKTVNEFFKEYSMTIISFFTNYSVGALVILAYMLMAITSIINYFTAEFIVTNKRIMIKSLDSFFKFKEIFLEDIKYIDVLKFPIFLNNNSIAIYKNNYRINVQPYIQFNMANPQKFKDELVSYIKSTENNSLKQEFAGKMTSYDSFKSLLLRNETLVNKQISNNDLEIPEKIQGWNWGAFFLNWFWGLFNKSYWSLLTIIPYLGIGWAFVCGLKGNEWAWKNNQWESVEQFQTVQKKWALYGVVFWSVFLGIALLFAIAGIIVPLLLN